MFQYTWMDGWIRTLSKCILRFVNRPSDVHKSIFLSHKYENLSKYSVVLIEQDTIDSSPQCPALIDVIGNIKVGFK